MEKLDKIYGSLLAAAVGDAMGGATECRSRDRISEYFGGFVDDFKDNPDDTFLRGKPKGYLTDDFSLAYYTAKAIVKSGKIDTETANDALVTWSKTQYYDYAGPSTRRAVNDIIGIENPAEHLAFLVCQNSKSTNGAGMKIAPVGLVSGGDIDKAIDDAIIMILPTHKNDIAISGGCAIAAATAAAMRDDATVDSVVKAAIYGAEIGYKKGGEIAQRLAGPSVSRRIALAAKIGESCKGDIKKAIYEIGEIIGSGLMTAEAIPAAIGLFVAADGDAKLAMLGGVNIGDDTDTVATMAGAVAGAFSGVANFPPHWAEMIDRENNIDLLKLAEELCQI